MSNVILNGDFSSGFDYWHNGVGGDPYVLDAGKIKGSSFSSSTTPKEYSITQSFALSEGVGAGTITAWCKWVAPGGNISNGYSRFIVELHKPDTSYVTLLDTTKTAESGEGNLLDGVNIAAHLTQAGTYWLYLILRVVSSKGENPDPPPTYSHGVSYGWYDNIGITAYYTYSITAEAGSYTEAGTATNLLKSSLIGIGTGSYVETGKVAGLLKSSKILIGAGSYTLTGQTVSFLRSLLISIEAGSCVITGKAVNLRFSIVPPVVYEGEQKTFAIFKSELLWVLGNRSSADINSMEGNLINDAYQGLCSKNKFWRFEVPPTFNFPELDTKKLATGNDGDAYISKPSDALIIHTVWDMTNDKELDYKDHTWYVAQTGRADANREARPSYWIPYSNKIYLYPTLNAEYNLAIYYRKRPDALTGTQTTVIGEQWDDPILMLATIRGLMLLREFNKAKEWRERFITTVQGLMGMQVRQARYTRNRLIPSSQHTQEHGY